MILAKASPNKTVAHDEMEILEICRLDVLTQDRIIFHEKLEDRFVISIHSSVQRKNTSEIIRFGRVVKIHEFIESPEFEFHDRLASHDNIESHVEIESPERLESHDRNDSSERKKLVEKSEFSIPDQSKFHVEIGDNERFDVGSIPNISSSCQLVSLSVWVWGSVDKSVSANVTKKF